MGRAYTKRLQDIPGLQLPVEESWARQVYWMYGVVLNANIGINAIQFAQKLKDQGVETRPFFLGMHEQTVFKNMGLFRDKQYPVAERIARQGLYLPSGLTLTEQQMDKVFETVKTILLN